LRPRVAMATAALFHIAVTLIVLGVGRFGLYPQQIDQDGIGQFARDGYLFRAETEFLAQTLMQDGVAAWLANPLQIHIKAYSISSILLRPVLGATILVAEPVNLFCYLIILAVVFGLAKRMAGEKVAWLASVIVALWPTFLLHTTQFLRDPILIAAILLLVLVLSDLIVRPNTWSRNLIAGVAGVAATLGLWMSRPDMWLVIRAIGLCALVLIAIRMWREKKLLLVNLTVVVLLFALMSFIPQVARSAQEQAGVSFGSAARDEGLSPWARIAARRRGFITDGLRQTGLMIDADVRFSSAADVIKYIPRAVEVGCFAPFPSTWFSRGYNVGLVGRLLAGIETSLTYALELFACVFLWQSRRRLDVWLLALTIMVGLLALGFVVVNVGTLYRMRYPFFILIVIMAAPVVAKWIPGNRGPTVKASVVDDSNS
jgi:4-amino-4-deoxy-L-arabinose transferase-like glycosyltransferase